MNKLITATIWRALRSAVAIWMATQVAHNVWYAPVALALAKALREKFPGKFEWLPI